MNNCFFFLSFAYQVVWFFVHKLWKWLWFYMCMHEYLFNFVQSGFFLQSNCAPKSFFDLNLSSSKSFLFFIWNKKKSCASRAIGTLLSSYSSLDSSNGQWLVIPFLSTMEKSIYLFIDAFQLPWFSLVNNQAHLTFALQDSVTLFLSEWNIWSLIFLIWVIGLINNYKECVAYIGILADVKDKV